MKTTKKSVCLYRCRVRAFMAGAVITFALSPSLSHGENAQQVYSEIPPITVDTPIYSEIPAVGDSAPVNNKILAEPKVYLKVFINDQNKNLIGEFIVRQDALFIAPKELEDIGLAADKNLVGGDGLIAVSRLKNVQYHYDRDAQAVHFHTTELAALAPTKIEIWRNRSAKSAQQETDNDEDHAQTTFGAVVNYTLYADSGEDKFRRLWNFQGVSSQFDARIFGDFGTLSSNQIVRFSSSNYDNTVRLDTSWSYHDDKRLLSYRVGDLTSSSLSWSRSVRLGGAQIRRNFSIRSDLVTMPLPSISGSAAVPSSVDVYVNNARRASADLPAGPYSLTSFPVVTGANVARMVVRDALGRETVTEVPFYASMDMLAKGLVDFSMEGGFVRYFYGTNSNDYSHDFASSATLRYGFSDHLTLEAHGEYVRDLYNGGFGTVFNLGSFGAMSLSYAGSSFEGKSGQQAAINLALEGWGIHFNARSQRSFGDYEDIASATAQSARTSKQYGYDASLDNYYSGSDKPAIAIDQLSLSMPLKIDPTSLNLSFTQAEYHNADKTRLLSFSAGRSFGNRVFAYATAYKDLKQSDSYGVFAGLTISFDKGIQLSTSSNSDRNGTSIQTELSKSERREIGSTGWRLRDIEGSKTERMASGSYRGRYARVEGSVTQKDENFRATAQIEGSMVLAGGGVFAANKIDDSFAIVDVGTPNVDVARNNQPYGRTGRNGKLIVPDLQSFQETRLSIDPQNMPLDAMATTTRLTVIPGYQTGVIAKFGVEHASDSALIALSDEEGKVLEIGSVIIDEAGNEQAIIGYDGQTLLPLDQINLPARFIVKRPAQKLCRLTVPTHINKGIVDGVTSLSCLPANDL